MTDDDDIPATRPFPARVASRSAVELGETIGGKYVVESVLGTGGMGTVVRARHVELEQHVAIKVMHAELLATRDAARRFAFEARATAALRSTHAVRVYDIDRLASGVPFLVMELLEGIDLGTMVATRGPLPLERVVQYLLEATDVIVEAHGRSIIHRDLKPRNLFLTSAGIIKVLDFGLAKALRPSPDAPPGSSRMGAGALIGSPSYMAPEQLLGTGEVDERTDVWALGATIYELLTGEPPFSAPSLDEFVSVVCNQEAPRVTARRRDLTPMVDDLVAQCLGKRPSERFASVGALQRALLEIKVAGVVLDPASTSPDATRRDLIDLDDERTQVSVDDQPVPTRRR